MGGDRLALVVSNLVGNAIQHGSGTPITLTAHEQRDSVTLRCLPGTSRTTQRVFLTGDP